MKKLILTALTLCLILLTATAAIANQKHLTRADIAETLNRPDILEAYDVITRGNKMVEIHWADKYDEVYYIEAISLPADKMRNIGNSARDYHEEQDNSVQYADNNQTGSEETDSYLEEVEKAVEKAKNSKAINDIIDAKNMLINNVDWDYCGMLGKYEGLAALLLWCIRDVPNVYSIYTDLISYAIQQIIYEQGGEIQYFTLYIKNRDKERAGQAIDFLNSLLDAEWKNPKAKEKSENRIRESIEELKKLQEK